MDSISSEEKSSGFSAAELNEDVFYSFLEAAILSANKSVNLFYINETNQFRFDLPQGYIRGAAFQQKLVDLDSTIKKRNLANNLEAYLNCFFFCCNAANQFAQFDIAGYKRINVFLSSKLNTIVSRNRFIVNENQGSVIELSSTSLRKFTLSLNNPDITSFKAIQEKNQVYSEQFQFSVKGQFFIEDSTSFEAVLGKYQQISFLKDFTEKSLFVDENPGHHKNTFQDFLIFKSGSFQQLPYNQVSVDIQRQTKHEGISKSVFTAQSILNVLNEFARLYNLEEWQLEIDPKNQTPYQSDSYNEDFFEKVGIFLEDIAVPPCYDFLFSFLIVFYGKFDFQVLFEQIKVKLESISCEMTTDDEE